VSGFCRREKSGAGAYRYGFNGKENDSEVKGLGNQQDYGMRIYDTRLGRFLSVDPFSTMFADATPYNFAGNSPTGLVDFNGGFKVSPFFVKRYPTLARFLESIVPALKGEESLRDLWIAKIGFKDKSLGIKTWNEMLTFGEGPWVTPGRRIGELSRKAQDNLTLGSHFFGEDAGGSWKETYPENIVIGYSHLDELEAALQNGNSKEISFKTFELFYFIMHEGGHWARHRSGKPARDDFDYEDGAMAEEALFGGMRFSYTSPRFADLEKQKYKPELARNFFNENTKGFNFSQGSIRVPLIPLCFGSGFLRNGKTPKGQLGDPSLIENGDETPKAIPKPYQPREKQKSNNPNVTYNY